jgi:hypothetical protein
MKSCKKLSHSRHFKAILNIFLATILMFAGGCAVSERATATSNAEGQWIPLFNGKNLDGWTPKITGYELGDNFGNTFRVEDGILKVGYDQYENSFNNRFGHLFYKAPLSHYRLRLEYRFVGQQLPDAPDWAYRNSGIMIHSQDPGTMRKEQEFPVCIEVQLLGSDGKKDRPTGNLCTPGTHVVMMGQLEKTHCINSTSDTFHGDQWVYAEIEVRGDEVIRHFINGRLVMEYQQPQLDETDPDAGKLIQDGSPLPLTGGYIALQSESTSCEFRMVEMMPLE